MGQTWPLFVDFDSFSQDNYKYGTYSTSAIGYLQHQSNGDNNNDFDKI